MDDVIGLFSFFREIKKKQKKSLTVDDGYKHFLRLLAHIRPMGEKDSGKLPLSTMPVSEGRYAQKATIILTIPFPLSLGFIEMQTKKCVFIVLICDTYKSNNTSCVISHITRYCTGRRPWTQESVVHCLQFLPTFFLNRMWDLALPLYARRFSLEILLVSGGV